MACAGDAGDLIMQNNISTDSRKMGGEFRLPAFVVGKIMRQFAEKRIDKTGDFA